MKRQLTEEERGERRIAWFMAGGCLLTLIWIGVIFGVAAWVIIRVTLHFT